VQWAAAQFGRELVMSSSFGADSAVLLHMATRAMPDLRVIVVDTGYLFPETHLFMEELRQKLNLNVWVYRTRNDPIAYLQHAGEGSRAEKASDPLLDRLTREALAGVRSGGGESGDKLGGEFTREVGEVDG